MIFSSGNSNNFNGKILAKFWKEYTGKELYSPYSAVGIHNDKYNILLGVIIFTEYTGSNIEIHAIGKNVLNKTTIKYIADYVFNFLSCNVLRVKLHSKTQKYIEDYLFRLGFEYECTLKKYYDIDDDAVVFMANRHKASKWINLNGRSKSSETSASISSS